MKKAELNVKQDEYVVMLELISCSGSLAEKYLTGNGPSKTTNDVQMAKVWGGLDEVRRIQAKAIKYYCDKDNGWFPSISVLKRDDKGVLFAEILEDEQECERK